MKTLSVKQPWAYLLCAGIKDIENRTWKLPEKYKGERVLIHASAKYELFSSLSQEQVELLRFKGIDKKYLIDKEKHFTSAIIGSVRFVDCVINHESVWSEKSHYEVNMALHPLRPIYNWVVADPVLFDKPIRNVNGKLSFWEYDMRNVLCPECGNPTHCQYLDDVLTDAFCMKCEKGVKQNN